MIKSLIATALLAIVAAPIHAKSWNVLDPKDVDTYLKWEFANARYFTDRILLDHDPIFTVYYTPTTKPEAKLFSIRIVYALDAGYGYSRGPFEVYFLKIGSDVRFYNTYSELESDLNYLCAHR
jgi:hypothetical protein